MVGEKPPGYYGQRRADLVAALPRPLGRVLDVGCGEGAVARELRAAGASAIAGIEINPRAAAVAAGELDELAVGPVEQCLERLTSGPWDTICCYDVLEHLVDPDAVLRALRSAAAPGGRLHVSVPNAGTCPSSTTFCSANLRLRRLRPSRQHAPPLVHPARHRAAIATAGWRVLDSRPRRSSVSGALTH